MRLQPAVLLLFAACAHTPVAPRTHALHAAGDQPTRDEVVALMEELAPAMGKCCRYGRYVMTKITLNGITGVIGAAEAPRGYPELVGCVA